MTLRAVTVLCGSLATAAGLVILAGWALGIAALKSMLPQYPAAQPITAVAMCVSGGALILLTTNATGPRRAALALAAVVILACFLTFLAYLGIDVGMDRWFFASQMPAQWQSYEHPGRMAEVTAICFLLVAVSIAAKALRSFERAAVACATVALLLATTTLLAYLFETAPLYEVAGFGHVSLPTATVLALLSAGALTAKPITGWPRTLTLDTPGAHAARALLPWAIGLPIVFNGMALIGSHAGLYSAEFRLAADSAVTAVLLCVVVLLTAARIDRANTGREAERTARALAEQRLQQAQKMAALGQMASSVAHDFNNLLHVLSAALKALARPTTEAGRRVRYIEAGEQSLERAAELTHSLLAFARSQPVEKRIFDAARRVRDMEHVLRTTLGSRLPLTLHLPNAPVWIEAEPTQFDVALLNLVVNARDASSKRGDEISISVEVIENPPLTDAEAMPRIALRVRDSGSGIPPETLPHLFEPFYTTKETGTGLGLAQVHAFARQSGGDVRVESKLGVGSTFTVVLPLGNRAGAREETDRATLRPVAGL